MEDHSEAIKQAVKIYKALGDPTRMNITLILTKESNLCVTAIGQRLQNVAGSTLSHHLKQLTDCGLIESTKTGSFIHYTLNKEKAEKYVPFLGA
ncbi:metalloregulator ArsR/SmtB family transcription factor [Paenibacillus sp. ACRSA]|uniref:ArsR/SmtB family transcription factor n=1 Tax=Paenibacillus sp. ACRSA TaxID=2918211 RepID=UPI001EF4401A|nr:metalloregulator ArsR/SmtB family transcription factor [Paenibacillus sp. ACRSA]MCG7378711.1 metalloregulator ArsR/SmtB family transcription factor [Paenibacillus sp. ACRSA]